MISSLVLRGVGIQTQARVDLLVGCVSSECVEPTSYPSGGGKQQLRMAAPGRCRQLLVILTEKTRTKPVFRGTSTISWTLQGSTAVSGVCADIQIYSVHIYTLCIHSMYGVHTLHMVDTIHSIYICSIYT